MMWMTLCGGLVWVDHTDRARRTISQEWVNELIANKIVNNNDNNNDND